MHFVDIFRGIDTNGRRGKFLSRVFGIFSEEVVRIWCRDENSAYVDIGRPTIFNSIGKYVTLDFSMKDLNGRIFVSELKCEIEYQNYKYATLTSAEQLVHHKKEAFSLFCAAATEKVAVKISGQNIESSGAILIWGDATEDGISGVKAMHGFHDILTISNMVRDLNRWKNQEFAGMLSERESWVADMCKSLNAL